MDLTRLLEGNNLRPKEAQRYFNALARGQMPLGASINFLLLLGRKGFILDELVAAAHIFRSQMTPLKYLKLPEGLIDTCGTGGDAKETFNISTAAAFVSAAAGAPVAKHGNRAVSSKCGSADLLRALGVNIEASTERMVEALKETGFGYFHAPLYHTSMRHVQSARKFIGQRTIFNVLGPLLNPLGVHKQLIGVFNKNLLIPMALAAKKLGTVRAIVVHGRDGQDEVSTTAMTDIIMLEHGELRRHVFSPEELGLKKRSLALIQGKTAAARAHEFMQIISNRGGRTAVRDAILLNSGFAIWAHRDKLALKDCFVLASQALLSGRVLRVVKRVREITRQS